MDKNVLYNADCLDSAHGMSILPDRSVDMILCDLPYGTTQCHWDEILPFNELWIHYKRVIKANGAIVLFGSEPFSSKLRLSNIRQFKYDWIWDKVKGTGFLNAKKQPMRNHEIISVFYGKQCTYNPQKTTGHIKKTSFRKSHLQTEVYGEMKRDYMYESTERYPRSIQMFSTDTQSSSLHPTQKPVKLIEYLILTYTNEGEIVLDNCVGSGTTIEACINTGRDWVCWEKDAGHYKTATDRMNLALTRHKQILF